MAPRHAGGVHVDFRVGVAAQEMIAVLESDAASEPFQTERHPTIARRDAVTLTLADVAKRVPEPVDCPDVSRARGIVADRFANLAHQIGQVLFDHERAGPETLLQIALG